MNGRRGGGSLSRAWDAARGVPSRPARQWEVHPEPSFGHGGEDVDAGVDPMRPSRTERSLRWGGTEHYEYIVQSAGGEGGIFTYSSRLQVYAEIERPLVWSVVAGAIFDPGSWTGQTDPVTVTLNLMAGLGQVNMPYQQQAVANVVAGILQPVMFFLPSIPARSLMITMSLTFDPDFTPGTVMTGDLSAAACPYFMHPEEH